MENSNTINLNSVCKSHSIPTFCCFTLTDACMLQCQMCQKWKEDISIKPGCRNMELDDWKKCATSLRKIVPDNFIINFGGGEITLVPWLFDIISFCKELGFKTNIATNAFLIDKVMVKKIASSKLDYINISLDSLDESLHDSLRGVKGVHAKVMEAVDLIDKYALHTKISICSIIMKPTLAGIVELIEWVQSNDKIDMIYLMVLMQPNNTTPQQQWWTKEEWDKLWPDDYEEAENVLDDIVRLKQKGYNICNPVEHLQAFKAYFKDPGKFVKKNACHIDRAVHISSVGDLFMCYQQECVGNLHGEDLKNLWTSEFASKVRNNIKKCQQNCHFLLNCNFEE
ncbi:MAG: radical SAM protein [Candidatus Omnitrophica bacterium]|nr:radical SAM protein [Candidatus Omnitrophota bacterium]